MSKKTWISLADLKQQHGVEESTGEASEGLVYSTEKGRLCPDCGQPKADCVCKARARESQVATGKVRVRLEKKGRKGKGVTIIEGLAQNEAELSDTAKALRQHCGVGGTHKAGTIELQGDQQEKARSWLKARKLL